MLHIMNRLKRFPLALAVMTVSALLVWAVFSPIKIFTQKPSASQQESKPSKGKVLSDRPVSYNPPEAKRACLLIHGLGGGPREMNEMAAFLAQKGIATETIRLPGHGATADRKMPVSGGSRGQEWLKAIQLRYNQLYQRYPAHVSLIGLSNGGSVSLAFAKRNQATKPLESVVLLAPFFKIAPFKVLNMALPVEPFIPFIAPILKETKRGPESAFDHSAQQALQAARPLDTFNLVTLQHSLALIQDVTAALPTIKTPALMILSTRDEVVDNQASQKAFERLGSSQKTLIRVHNSNHILPLDHDRAQVEQWVYAFLNRS
ncbi:MAG: alpha/beta fold hydrolase [Vampirovibrionales bacterium]|nr:alpha/beta fold hydrolase [Vampirovibrionales bacterium]